MVDEVNAPEPANPLAAPASLDLGRILRVHATAYVAAEPVPLYWPMRAFIHNNPLHGLENQPFTEAVQRARELFHARVYLPRSRYQHYRQQGLVDEGALERETQALADALPSVRGIDLGAWVRAMRDDPDDAPFCVAGVLPQDVRALLDGVPVAADTSAPEDRYAALVADLPPEKPLTECIDALWGTTLANDLDELVIKSCLDFFDEDQSSWHMPGREQGFYRAWSEVARRNLRFSLRGLGIAHILDQVPHADEAIAHVMRALGIPETHWQGYFSHELMRLHGWAGFTRWRSGAKHYHWGRKHPADLVDYLAVRLVFALALIEDSAAQHGTPRDRAGFEAHLREQPDAAALRRAFHDRSLLPGWAQRIDDTLERGQPAKIAALSVDYSLQARRERAAHQADILRALAQRAGVATLEHLAVADVAALLDGMARFDAREGEPWLRALEAHAIARLVQALATPADLPAGKRPFAQALFCIDVRSERLRRHLEAVGDYQTFGIAGFFGVPVGFLGYGKGSETHLCPALATPHNLVLEIPAVFDVPAEAFASQLEHVLHDLKSSVLSPFVTVEAIGALFGLDLFGKTLAPRRYHHWRSRIDAVKPVTRLLLDKLSREQADSIVRALQRAIIVKALYTELQIERERVTDDMIRELRETALGHCAGATCLQRELGLTSAQEAEFIATLRESYRVDAGYANHQMGQLGRIGFSLDEQINYVWTALTSIGLTTHFSRFVLVVGHVSRSENNPYESALDCGACGGSSGLTSARVLAQMANKADVRRGLRERGIDIPADTWFVPGLHTTTTDRLELHDMELLPPQLLVYLERLRAGLQAASRLCAAERVPTLVPAAEGRALTPAQASRMAQTLSLGWSQVRPEWGLSGNLYFVVGRRGLTQKADLKGRSFLQSYDWRCDPKGRLLENLLAGPVVVAQWINMEHYFSTVDNAHFGSGSKVYHNVAGRFGVMTGNQSDLRTGLPSQTVLRDDAPYHEPLRLIVVIEAPLESARRAIESVVKIQHLVQDQWIRTVVIDPTQAMKAYVYDHGRWQDDVLISASTSVTQEGIAA
jgi:uncharacterized protein YbcC (UPF0753/DUF2309 family)